MRGLLFGAAALSLLLAACGPRYSRRGVEDQPGLTVLLRGERQAGALVDRGYAHPATVAPIRLARILAELDVRFDADAGGERRAAVPSELLYEIADGISRALAKAGPAEEVVVQAVRKQRRLGLFTSEYLTSLICYVENDQLVLHLRHADTHLEKGGGREREVPEPWVKRRVGDFRLVPGPAMTALGPQEVAVAWRDPVFGKASRMRVSPEGRVQRRTILLESPDEELAPEPAETGVPAHLSPATLRALADLEEARRAGELTEPEYQARRRELLAAEAGAR